MQIYTFLFYQYKFLHYFSPINFPFLCIFAGKRKKLGFRFYCKLEEGLNIR